MPYAHRSSVETCMWDNQLSTIRKNHKFFWFCPTLDTLASPTSFLLFFFFHFILFRRPLFFDLSISTKFSQSGVMSRYTFKLWKHSELSGVHFFLKKKICWIRLSTNFSDSRPATFAVTRGSAFTNLKLPQLPEFSTQSQILKYIIFFTFGWNGQHQRRRIISTTSRPKSMKFSHMTFLTFALQHPSS